MREYISAVFKPSSYGHWYWQPQETNEGRKWTEWSGKRPGGWGEAAVGTSRRSMNCFPWIMPGGWGSGERMLAPDSSFHWFGSSHPQFFSILPHSYPFSLLHPLCVRVHIPLVRTPLMYAFVLRYIIMFPHLGRSIVHFILFNQGGYFVGSFHSKHCDWIRKQQDERRDCRVESQKMSIRIPVLPFNYVRPWEIHFPAPQFLSSASKKQETAVKTGLFPDQLENLKEIQNLPFPPRPPRYLVSDSLRWVLSTGILWRPSKINL